MRSQIDWALADAGASSVARATAAKVRTVKRRLVIFHLSFESRGDCRRGDGGSVVALFGFASNYLPLPTGETWLAATIPTHGSATAVPRREFRSDAGESA